ncbi:hypothetical protein SEA_UPYO_57 [Gordonia phage Upyo]|nr:hypothetical protein SEA_UPYO_57 [Gordonia phage Upyo]
MTKRPATIHKVILCSGPRDYAAVVARDPSKADWTPIYAESQLYGLWISEWAITERAGNNMRQLGRMCRYLETRARLTRLAHPN